MYSIDLDVRKIYSGKMPVPYELKGKRILLLGATGVVLSYAARFLLELNRLYGLNIQVVCHGRSKDRLESLFSDLLHEECIYFEVFDLEQGIPEQLNVDFVIHGASPANGTAFVKQPVETILPNVIGTKSVMEYAKKREGTCVLYMSSAAVYGDVHILGKALLTEQDYGIVNPLDDRSSYVESKRLGEQMCSAYAREYGVRTIIARIPYTYAPTYLLAHDTRFIPKILNRMLHEENVSINHEEDTVQYTYAGDVVSAMLLLLLKGVSGNAYNICIRESYPVEILLQYMYEALSPAGTFEILHANNLNPDSKGNVTTNQKMDPSALEALGWECQFSLQEGANAVIRGIKSLYSTS